MRKITSLLLKKYFNVIFQKIRIYDYFFFNLLKLMVVEKKRKKNEKKRKERRRNTEKEYEIWFFN